VDYTFLRGLALGDNPLAEALGLLDGLITALLRPLDLWSGGTSGVNINVLG
jgi:hypothetical protein